VPLPNFLIIGAAKAGTSSLHQYLDEHPEIFMSAVKEPNFFSASEVPQGNAVRSMDEYLELFAGVTTETAIGESSPSYLRTSLAAERIHAALPDARLIVSLRDPVERLYSLFLHNLRNGRASRDVYEWFGRRPSSHYGYAAQLTRFFDRFPRERIHVLLYEDFAAAPKPMLTGIFEFLDVDSRFVPDMRVRHNTAEAPMSLGLTTAIDRLARVRRVAFGWVPGTRQGTGALARLRRANLSKAPPPPPDIRERLLPSFADDIRRTGELIGRDLSRWLDASPRSAPSAAG